MTAAEIRIHPVWEAVSQPLVVSPESTLRQEIARSLGVQPRPLIAVDSQGIEVDLDRDAPPEHTGSDGILELAISLCPIVRTTGLFGRASPCPHQTETAEALTEEAVERTELEGFKPAERAVAQGLADLGLYLGSSPPELEGLVAKFPELPPGFGLRSLSPYRFLFAAVHFLEQRRRPELEELETRAELAAEELTRRLQLAGGSALDTRLYLFSSRSPSGRRTLSDYLADESHLSRSGRRRRGWRRVLIVLYSDERDRLRRTARLGQQLTIEARSPNVRQSFQQACGRYAAAYSQQERWLDHQDQVLLRPAEERIRSSAELALAERLERWLDPCAHSETASAEELARRLLARSGFLDANFAEDGQRVDELAVEWSEPSAGGPINDLGASDEPALTDWLGRLRASTGPDSLPADEAGRLARTLAVTGACRLRCAIEELLERDVLPRLGDSRLSFGRFVGGLLAVGRELERLTEEGSWIAGWLAEREDRVVAELDRRRRVVLTASERSGVWWYRLQNFLGVAGNSAQLAEAIRAYEKVRVQLVAIRALLDGAQSGELFMTFEGILELIARFEGLSTAARGLGESLARDARTNDALLCLGAENVEQPLPRGLKDDLARAVEEIDLAPAFGAALRLGNGFRNLLRVWPESTVEQAWKHLGVPLERAVATVAERTRLPRLLELLDLGLHRLFVDSSVPHTGCEGRVGALDGRTHLVALTAPSLLPRDDGEKAIVSAIRERLPGLGVSHELLIDVIASSGVPGLLLIRCVHALAPGEVNS